MTDLDLERLRGIAQAATPGPWRCWNGWGPVANTTPPLMAMTRIGPDGAGGVQSCAHSPARADVYATRADAEHIAEFSPEVCLRLIQEIQRQPKEATQIEVEGYIAEFVGDPAFVAAALLEKFSVRLKEEK